MKKWAQKQTGFTIVELLIVIVVIAILASITIVSYSGIRDRARSSTMSSELSQIARAVEVFKASSTSSRYPTALSQVEGVRPVTGLNYFYNATNNLYCMDYTVGDIVRSIGPRSGQREGKCALNGLVTWMPFNGTTTETVSNAGVTLAGAASYDTGAGGTDNGAYVSTNANMLTLTNPAVPSNPNQVTISAWAKGTGGAAGYSYLFFRSTTSSIGNSLYWLGTRETGQYSASAHGDWGSISTGVASNTTTWRHLVMTYDGSRQRVYIDGQLRASSAVSPSNATTGTTANIGSGPTVDNRPFLGLIDDLRIYNRVMTDTEVANLYDVGAY